MSNFDDLLAQQLADEEEQQANNNNEEGGDDDDDDDENDNIDDEALAGLSESELLARAAADASAGVYDVACNTYSVVLERRRAAGESEASASTALVYLAYGAALFKNAVKSIDALGHAIVAAGAENLESDGVKQQLVQHGSTAMDDLELAFQILECARTSFEAHHAAASPDDTAAYAVELADTYALLADVNLENDNFVDARADLDKALAADARAAGGARPRFVADVSYKLGLSFLSEKNKSAARPHLAEARAQLRALLAAPSAAASGADDDNGKAKATAADLAAAKRVLSDDERKQAEATLGEVEARLGECEPDALEEQAAAVNAADAAAAAAPRRNAFDAPRNAEAAVENLGTLGGMRVKRKSDAVAETATEQQSKK